MDQKAMWLVLAVSSVVFAFVPPRAEAAMSCSTVTNSLSPCINFVLYGGPKPPANCCSGIKDLYHQASAAGAVTERRTICSCLKSVASSATPQIINNAAALPEKCGVTIPYKISPGTNCDNVR